MSTITQRITGPFKFENLSVFLLHGSDSVPAGSYMALQRAMDRKQTIVHETGTVGELQIENLGEQDVFLQAGDIVKGGRQDRVLGVDLIVGRKSGRVPIPTFCVEKGRWSQRGPESAQQFSSSKTYIASKALRNSTQVLGNQAKVWETVSLEQAKLTQALKTTVNSSASATSYQLSLENEQLKEKVQEGMSELKTLLASNRDAVGFVFAVNGELNNADIYGNHDLFEQLWEKLLTATLTEAIAESKNRQTKGDPTLAQVEHFLSHDFERPTDRQVPPRVLLKQYKGKGKSRFDTEDLARSRCIHTSVLSS